VVRVKVLDVDIPRKRISLTLRLDDETPRGGERPAGGGRDRTGGSRPSGGGRDRTGGRPGRDAEAPANTAMAEALRRAGLNR
jgi:uncharacterized protein